METGDGAAERLAAVAYVELLAAAEGEAGMRSDTKELKKDVLVRYGRLVRGALVATIDAHGPVTKEQVPSAVKRIVGEIFALVRSTVDEIDNGEETVWRIKRQPHWRASTVAERTHPKTDHGPVEHTLRDLVETNEAANAEAGGYLHELSECKRRAQIERPRIDYTPIAKNMLHNFWLRHVQRAAQKSLNEGIGLAVSALPSNEVKVFADYLERLISEATTAASEKAKQEQDTKK